jgi:predicted enzyme related to lactoylglutathione lyase
MPTRDEPWPAGTPCWTDYAAADVDAARAFYSAVLGFDYTGGEEEYGGYLQAMTRGRPAAGVMARMAPDAPVGWTTYFATDDAEAATARITEAGGTVVAPAMDVGPLGRMAVAVDPTGAVFGVWQAGEFIGEQVFNEPGSVVWNEAALEDAARARDFYGRVFGFSFDPVDGAGDYTTFRVDERPLGGLGAAQPGTPRGWLTCFAVASADDAVAAVEANGGKVVTPATDTPFGRFAVVEDAWGAAFEVMQTPPEA